MKNTNSHFSNLDEALLWINSNNSKSKLGITKENKLARISEALALFGNPQNSFKSIHITGSKGKSSTSYACSYILHSLNIQTGLFISPHIHSYNERIQINHSPISNELLLKTLNMVYQLCAEHTISLTMFEILTLSACIIFREQKVEYAVFEVGIGGRYDTTNFLQPSLCIITEIEKEHIDILGDTIELIALDKAGIIKPNTPVWISKQSNNTALKVLLAEASKQQTLAYYAPDYIALHFRKINALQKFEVEIETLNTKIGDVQEIALWNNITVQSPSISRVLVENQILADLAIHSLLQLDPNISSHIYENKIQAFCRSELIAQDNVPNLYLDGAHTTNSVHSTMSCISTLANKIVLVVALSPGKDHIAIANVLNQFKSIISNIIVTKAGTFKDNNPQLFYSSLAEYFDNLLLIENEAEAMQQALTLAKQQSQALISVIGSFYLCADCRKWWLNNT